MKLLKISLLVGTSILSTTTVQAETISCPAGHRVNFEQNKDLPNQWKATATRGGRKFEGPLFIITGVDPRIAEGREPQTQRPYRDPYYIYLTCSYKLDNKSYQTKKLKLETKIKLSKFSHCMNMVDSYLCEEKYQKSSPPPAPAK